MKTAMKLTTSILAMAVVAGGWGAAQAVAQNPDAIDNARSLAKSLQQKQANDTNAVLNAAGVPAPAKPAAGAPQASPAPAQTQPKQAQPKPAQPKQAQPSQQAKSTPAPPAKSSATPSTAKPAATSKTAAPKAPAAVAKAPAQPAAKKTAKAATTKIAAANPPADKSAQAAAKPADKKPDDKPADKKDEKKQEEKKWAMSGKRDPFFSPVVQQTGSSCSTGKKCLEIGNINLHGIVKSDSGFIAVVTNNMGKAYFLRENDPVFNGFVVKITGDSVVFEETVEDKLGKPFTREVVKRIFTPAV